MIRVYYTNLGKMALLSLVTLSRDARLLFNKWMNTSHIQINTDLELGIGKTNVTLLIEIVFRVINYIPDFYRKNLLKLPGL